MCGVAGLHGLLARAADNSASRHEVIVTSTRPAAPDELALGLHSAVRMALAKNNAIRLERFAPAIAGEHVKQQLGAFDPILAAHGGVNQTDSPAIVHTHKGKSEVINVRTVDEQYGASVRVLTPTGGVVSVGSTAESYFNKVAGERQIYRSSALIGVTQPLLNGFGVDVTMAPIRLARADRQISVWDFRQTVINIVTETIQDYDQLYFARAAVTVAEHSRDLAQQLLEERQGRVAAGTLTPLDVSVARYQVASREVAIINARETTREAENALKLCVSDDAERFLSIHLNIAPPDEREPSELDFDTDLPHAYAYRPDYQQMLIGLQERQITLVFDRSHARPQLDLVASLGSSGLDQSMGTSLAQTFHGDYLGASAGLTLQLPILNRAGQASVASARLEVAQELIALKKLEQEIVVDLDNALSEVRTGRARIKASQETLRLARESLDSEQKKLALGTSSTYAVLQIQDELTAAETAVLQAHTTYQKALAEYDRQTGRTLERNGIELAN